MTYLSSYHKGRRLRYVVFDLNFVQIEDLKKNLPLIVFLLLIFGPVLVKIMGELLPILIISLLLIFIFHKKIGNFDVLKDFFKESVNVPHKPKNDDNIIDVNKLKFMQNTKRTAIIIISLVLAIWLVASSVQVVDAGQTGVYSLFGKVRDKELSSGLHFVIPIAKVTRMSIRTEEYTMSMSKGEGERYDSDAITSLTKEGLSVNLDMTVLYRLQEDKASDVYREVGLDYQEKIIRPTIRTSIRDIIANYEAKDIYSNKREEASEGIMAGIKKAIEPRGIEVEKVLLRNVELPADLARSIQSKLQAEQESERYDFVLDKEKKEKERKIIEAEGQRESQSIINESLTTNYLYYLYVNNLKDREGTIYVPTGTNTGVPLFRNLGN